MSKELESITVALGPSLRANGGLIEGTSKVRDDFGGKLNIPFDHSHNHLPCVCLSIPVEGKKDPNTIDFIFLDEDSLKIFTEALSDAVSSLLALKSGADEEDFVKHKHPAIKKDPWTI